MPLPPRIYRATSSKLQIGSEETIGSKARLLVSTIDSVTRYENVDG